MILYAAADNLYRLDPTRFPTLHSLEKPPFYAVPPKAPDATVGGMPYGNALFSYVWYNAFIKFVNMAPYTCPTQHENLDLLFERKIPKPDGNPSDQYFINEYLIAYFMFTVACATNASVHFRKERKGEFRRHVAILKAAAAAGKDWRGQLRDNLKKWEPEFLATTRKKRRIGGTDELGMFEQEMQVDPAQL
jgi:hypothetical protein